MDYCPRCYKCMTKFHTCEKFTITDGGDGTVMWGKDFKDVVERYAEEWNEYDRPVYDGEVFDTPITVTDEDGIVKRFNCIAETELHYYAKELPYGIGVQKGKFMHIEGYE